MEQSLPEFRPGFLKRGIVLNSFNWDTTWEGVSASMTPSITTKTLWDKFVKSIELKNKSLLEIGAGTGIFCYMSLKAGASSVTVLDNSKEAIRIAKGLLSDEKADFIEANALEYNPVGKYDIVFSNGVIEHFPGESFYKCLEAHRNASKDKIVLLCPASPHYNDIRVKYSRYQKLYGYQKPVSKRFMLNAFKKCDIEPVLIERFFPRYGIHFESIWPFSFPYAWKIERRIRNIGFYSIPDAILKPLEKLIGGFLIAVGSVK